MFTGSVPCPCSSCQNKDVCYYCLGGIVATIQLSSTITIPDHGFHNKNESQRYITTKNYLKTCENGHTFDGSPHMTKNHICPDCVADDDIIHKISKDLVEMVNTRVRVKQLTDELEELVIKHAK